MIDNEAHRRWMIKLAKRRVVSTVLLADIFEPPKSMLGGGLGLGALVGIITAWRDTNRAGGLPPHVMVVVTEKDVLLYEARRSLSGWTIGYEVVRWPREVFVTRASKTGPTRMTVDIGGNRVELAAAVGAGAVAAELVALLTTPQLRSD